MSTWNYITVERLDGQAIDSKWVSDTIRPHLELDSLDSYDLTSDEPTLNPSANSPAECAIEGWSKYSIALDNGGTQAASAKLGASYRLTHEEQWDDEGPGGSVSVYINGEFIKGDSTTLINVSDALSAVLDVSNMPRLYSLAEIRESTDFAPDARFIAVLA